MNKLSKVILSLAFLSISNSNLPSDITLKSDLNNNKKIEDIVIERTGPTYLKLEVLEEGKVLYKRKTDSLTYLQAIEVVKYNNQDFLIYALGDGGNSGGAELTEVYFENGELKEYQEEVTSPKIIKKSDDYILQTSEVTDRTGSQAEWKSIKIFRNLPLSKNKKPYKN